MIRLKRGDLVTPGLNVGKDEGVAIFDSEPFTKVDPNVKLTSRTDAKVVGHLGRGDVAIVVSVVDKDNVLITTGRTIGITLTGWLQRVPGRDETA